MAQQTKNKTSSGSSGFINELKQTGQSLQQSAQDEWNEFEAHVDEYQTKATAHKWLLGGIAAAVVGGFVWFNHDK